jgi:hypothetical protein
VTDDDTNTGYVSTRSRAYRPLDRAFSMNRKMVSSRNPMNRMVPSDGSLRARGAASAGGVAGVNPPVRRIGVEDGGGDGLGDRRAPAADAGGPIVESWFGTA